MTDTIIVQGVGDIVSKQQTGNQTLSQLLALFTNIFPRSIGVFTMAAASSKVITDNKVTTTSFVSLTPTNAAAATLMAGTASLYVTLGNGSFTVATASGASAVGSETFGYSVSVPL